MSTIGSTNSPPKSESRWIGVTDRRAGPVRRLRRLSRGCLIVGTPFHAAPERCLAMTNPLRRLLLSHPVVTFGVMGVSFAGFSLLTLNVFHLLSANLDYIARDSLMALMEGAGLQLAELIASLAVALAFYLLFKACERILVDRLTR
jgi:hypothetical protein